MAAFLAAGCIDDGTGSEHKTATGAGADLQWRTVRGPGAGTQVAAGAGGLDNTVGGHPARAWSYQHTSRGYKYRDPVVGDFDGDSRPEVIGLSRGRLYLWDEDGTVLATSVSMPRSTIHGLYDLDGDGSNELLVAAGRRVGLGLVVVDPETLAVLWTSDDPGFNSGVTHSEIAVVDLDGDRAPEIVWNPAVYGMGGFHAVSFATGFSDPLVVDTTLPEGYNNEVLPVAGNYFGGPGDAPTSLATHQYTTLSFFSPAAPGDPGAQCQDGLCLRVDGQFPNVTEGYTFGTWVSFDADGDGDDEFLSTSRVPQYSLEITAVDPSAGLAGGAPDTDAGVIWQYRYGLRTYIDRQSYITEAAVRGARSSTGQAIAPVSLRNPGTNERDHYDAPADDCLENPGGWGVVVFDAARGTPLATLTDARAWAQVDSDRDGVSEIVMQKSGGGVAGYELECSGVAHGDGWLSCESTGCELVEAWSVPGSLEVYKPQVMSPTTSHNPVTNTPSVLDLDGDGVEEIVVRDGDDLVAYRLDPALGPVELGRHGTGACKTLGSVTGAGAGTWLLLEGARCFAVLDATLTEVAGFTVSETHGTTRPLTGHMGVPVIGLPRKIIMDPLGDESVRWLGRYMPVLFTDLDQDGVDEVICLDSRGAGDWRVAALAWQGDAFQELWSLAPADVGDTVSSFPPFVHARQHFAAGDFDGDGDPDVAIHPIQPYQPDKRLSPVYLLDGRGDGSGGARLMATHTPDTAGYRRANLTVADLCAGGVCPGADGRDELVVPGRRDFALYDAMSGLIAQFDRSFSYLSEHALADFDGDGHQELGAAVSFTHVGLMRAEVRETGGALRWTRTLDSGAGRALATAFADVSGDGAADFIYGGGYGELAVYSGRDGAPVPGFPIYLSQGLATTEPGDKPLPITQVVAADVDGDSRLEAVVAHQDGYLYAVNVDTAEGAPSILWSMYYGAPVTGARVADLDDDGLIEVLVMVRDGHLHVIDTLDAFVTIDEPAPEQCVAAPQIAVSGTAAGVDAIVVSLNGAQVAALSPDQGAWDAGVVTLPGQGEFVITVDGLVDGVVRATTARAVTHWNDDDGDGHSECTGDCDDADPASYPGAAEICDGRDNDCDGVVPAGETEDTDGDGVAGCADVCPGTTVDAGVILPNHYRWLGGETFTTNAGNARRPELVDSDVSMAAAAGCSCAQIIEAMGVGLGHERFGCSPGLMSTWLDTHP